MLKVKRYFLFIIFKATKRMRIRLLSGSSSLALFSKDPRGFKVAYNEAVKRILEE